MDNFKLPNIKKITKHVSIIFDTSEFEEKFERTQIWLENQIVEDMIPYLPSESGNFREEVIQQNKSHEGEGIIEPYAGEYGHFLYEGKAMISPTTGSAWARPGESKVYSGELLSYTNPITQPHWFDTVKKNHWKSWVSGAIREFRRKDG